MHITPHAATASPPYRWQAAIPSAPKRARLVDSARVGGNDTPVDPGEAEHFVSAHEQTPVIGVFGERRGSRKIAPPDLD